MTHFVREDNRENNRIIIKIIDYTKCFSISQNMYSDHFREEIYYEV